MNRTFTLSAITLAALSLTACGGGGHQDSTDPMDSVTAPVADAATLEALPSFHRLPVEVEPPTGDEDGSGTSAFTSPQEVSIPSSLAGISTARQTDADVANAPAQRLAAALPVKAASFTPAQIRTAYGMPAIPTGKLTAQQAADLGAGQTIYIVDAYDNPNAISDLALFNAKFGLPTCTTVAIPATAKLPLAAAPTTGCTISKVYTANGNMTATAPAYNATWASEISLDVQWAHAQAPLARIVLVEANNSVTSSLVFAIQLANKMGPGVVSMSFGAAEGSYVTGYNAIFQGQPGMTYVASAGDSGYAANWPAVSANVLAVGGTSLMLNGTSRTETTWRYSGGGISTTVPVPGYQFPLSMYGTTQKSTGRGVNDVSFVADPNTGMFVVMTPPGGAASWKIFGGTSAGAPQWAGMMAVANAQRVFAGKAALTIPHAALYTGIAAVPGRYVSAFYDVTTGVNGTTAQATARAGYDIPTGLGTPNFNNLSTLLKSY